MDFKIVVPKGRHWYGKATFWWDSRLCGDNVTAMNYFKMMLDFHEPKLIVHPGTIDYSNDLTNGIQMYRALLDIFKEYDIIIEIEPSPEFMDDNVPRGAVY